MAATSAALCAAAESALLVGHGEHAASLLADALDLADDPAARADVLCLRARVAVLTGDGPAILARLRAEADELAGTGEAGGLLAARVLLDAAVLALYGRDPDTLQIAQRAHMLAGSADPLIAAQTATVLGIAYSYTGNPELGRQYLQRSADVIRLRGSPQQVVHLLQCVVVGLAGLESYTDALNLCRQYAAAVRSVGANGLLPLVLALLANTAYFTADFDVMEMAAAEALALARGQEQQPLQVYAHVCLALVLAIRGDADLAREHVGQALELIDTTGARTFVCTAYLGLGLVELGAQSWQAAADCFALVRAALDDLPSVSGTMHWRAEHIEALWRSSEHEAARAVHAEMLAGLDSEGPWAHAAAARVGALLASDDEQAQRLFIEAMSWHERSSSAFERARTELCWGEWLLERGRPAAAADQLRRAVETFTRLGARPWAARSHALLDQAIAAPVTESAPDAAPAAANAAEPSTAEPVQIRAFGALTVVRGGVATHVTLDTPGRVLHYLVASGGSVHAEQLADALWPDAASAQGNTRLRNVLSRVRSRYGPVIVRSGPRIRWADGVSVDADRFAELARVALTGPRDGEAIDSARQAVALYDGELLALERYSEWATSARERVRQRYLAMLELLLADATERGELAVAIGYARQTIEADPHDDEAHVRLARLQLDAGRISHARETISQAKAVARELGLPIRAELAVLERRIAAT